MNIPPTPIAVSVFIIALNEADRIIHTLKSVQGWVDEVIVVDSGSTDNTLEVAKSFGAKVFSREWTGYGAQKRFAEDQCRNEWLLNLDADEAISPELAAEIQQLFANGSPPHAGYYIDVANMLPGEDTPPRYTQVNSVLRLYHKLKGRFRDDPVHDSVVMWEGQTARLKHRAHHRCYRSVAHVMDKINRYSTAQAEQMQQQDYVLFPGRIYLEFPIALFKGLFVRRFILRGRRGFIYAMIYAFSRFLRLAKFIEDQTLKPRQ